MSDSKQSKISRRKLIASTGTVAAGVAAMGLPGGTAEAKSKGYVPRWVMVMDLRKCVGCSACTVACKAENNVSLGRFRTVIQRKVVGTFPDVTRINLPLMCNHCEGNKEDEVPPCVHACPEFPGKRLKFKTVDGKTIRYRGGATYKRPDGLILIDKEKCIGCGKCIDACPYGVRSFDPFVKAGARPEKQAADKCDFCVHRLDNGVQPSCAETCPPRARVFGDMNDPDSEVSKLIKEHNLLDGKHVLLPEENTDPHVFYIDPDNMLKQAYTQRKEGKLDHYVDHLDS